MGLRAVSSSSSSRRLPAGHAQFNMSVRQGTEMQNVTFFPYFCGCFGRGGVAEVARETASKENKAKKNKPLAIFRRILKRKSQASSTNVLPAVEENNVEEARVPVESSRDTGAAITSVDTDMGRLQIPVDAKLLDVETRKSSPPNFSSAESHTTITCSDREGNHDWMVSPILQSFRFSSSGDDEASRPQILLLDNKVDCISPADTSGTVACNGKEESQESTESPILNFSSLTMGIDDGARKPDILSQEIKKQEKEKEETIEICCPVDSGSSAETGSTVRGTGEEVNCKIRVTLEMLMEMENLSSRDRYDGEGEGELGVGDCVSSSVSRSPFVYWSNQQSRMTVKPSSGSPFFAQPDDLFPPSPRRLSSPSHSTVTSTDGAVDSEMTVVLKMLMEMENLVPGDTYDAEAERELEVRDRVCGSISSSPFVCWSNRQGRMTVEPPFGSTLFEHPDSLFPPSPGPHCSPPRSSVTSTDRELDHETMVTLETLMEMENLLPRDRYDGEGEGELGVGDCVSSSVSRSPFVCGSNRQSRVTVWPSSGSTLFAQPDDLFPPSPRTPSSPSTSSLCIERSFSEDGGDENIRTVPVPGREDTNRNQWMVASTSHRENADDVGKLVGGDDWPTRRDGIRRLRPKIGQRLPLGLLVSLAWKNLFLTCYVSL